MVKKSVCIPLFLCCVFFAAAQDDAAIPSWTPLSPRLGLQFQLDNDTEEVQTIANTIISLLTQEIDAAWFNVPADNIQEFTEDLRIDVLLKIAIMPNDGTEVSEIEPQFRVVYTIIHMRGIDVIESEEIVQNEVDIVLDLFQGYQELTVWEALINDVQDILPLASPGVTVRFYSNTPFMLQGLPAYAGTSVTAEKQKEQYAAEVVLRSLRIYNITANYQGYSTQNIQFYLERRPMNIEVSLLRHWKHTVMLGLRGATWPTAGYAYYLGEKQEWSVGLQVTSFLGGFTPLSILTNYQNNIVASLPLTELVVEGGYTFGHPDNEGRWAASFGFLTRLHHEYGLDPVYPMAIRLGFGRDQAVGYWLTLTQKLTTDLYFPMPEDTALIPYSPWVQRLGPVAWQYVLYHIGIRAAL